MNIKITKQVNLDLNDGLSSVFGLAAQQHHDVYQVFYDFIQNVKPARILEIGTALGGFTQFLKLSTTDLNLATNIRTYDIHRMNWYGDIMADGIDVRVENIFNPDYSACLPEVVDYIQQPGITIVLCDGGDKVREFNLLSTHIKAGDFILAHDYSESTEVFDSTIKGKRWNWCEITRGNISNAIEVNGLVYHEKQKFENVVWTCLTKP